MNLIKLSQIPLTPIERSEMQKLLGAIRSMPNKPQDELLAHLVTLFREDQRKTGITDQRVMEICKMVKPYIDPDQVLLVDKLLTLLHSH